MGRQAIYRFTLTSNRDRKSTRLNSSHTVISYAVFCLKKKKKLKDFDTGKPAGPHPHDELIAEIDRLLADSAALSGSRDFRVEGEWTAAFFFFNDTATTEIYTLSLHDALPI